MQHKDNNREFNDLYRRFDEAMSKVDLPDKGQLMSLIASHSEAKPSRRRLWVAVAAAVAALVVATFAVTLFLGGDNNKQIPNHSHRCRRQQKVHKAIASWLLPPLLSTTFRWL